MCVYHVQDGKKFSTFYADSTFLCSIIHPNILSCFYTSPQRRLVNRAKECSDIVAAGGRLDKPPSSAIFVLAGRHLTMADCTQSSQVVNVAGSSTFRHRHDVIHVPELAHTHTHKHTHRHTVGFG